MEAKQKSLPKPQPAILNHTKTGEEGLSVAAFREMLEPVKQHLYNFIFKSLGFSEDAEDVFQETVLRALKYLSSFQPHRSFKTWIFTIAHNQVKSYYKKNTKRQESSHLSPFLEDQPGDTLSLVPTALDEKNNNLMKGAGPQLQEKDLITDIYEVATSLEPSHRKTFFLFYDQGFTIREIAGITGLKEGNIKFILNRSREKIKQKLGLRSKNNDKK